MYDAVDLSAMLPSELEAYVVGLREAPYRAKQLFAWLHKKQVKNFSEMTDLGKKFRETLSLASKVVSADAVRKQVSSDGTIKYLFALQDGNCVETVAMRYSHGISLCVSSQVGCRMGCAFCASTQSGLVRSLDASEILAQVYAAHRDLGERIDSVVMMGIGEPLDNFENTLRFYELVTHPDGYGLSNRAVSISTCGIVPKIYELADRKLQLTLSVSLHAATDEKRNQIMPINRRYPLKELMQACQYYTKTTNRRISYEYAVISGVNDGVEDADRIRDLLGGALAHVNLIPVNPAVRKDFRATRGEALDFAEKLKRRGLNATVRRTLGSDISAACGQLRRDNLTCVEA